MSPAFITCDPADRSVVSTLPRFGTRQAVFSRASGEVIDPVLSHAVLLNPNRTSIGQASLVTGPSTVVVPLASPLPGNGTVDGRYTIESDIFDRAGNPSPHTTCTFIFDTLPPQILTLFPANLSCARFPLRHIHAELIDAIAGNAFPPAPSGVDLSRAEIKLRLLVADPMNATLPGTELTGVKQYRTTTAPFDEVALEFLDATGAVRSLRDDG